MMQITATIISPTFLSAANFMILGIVVERLGSRYSWISAKKYSLIFVSADVLALLIQAGGGAMASIADTQAGSDRGGNIMLVGIILQIVAMTVYIIVAADFLRRFFANKPVRDHAQIAEMELSENSKLRSESPMPDWPVKQGSARPVPDALEGRMKLMILGLSLSTLFLFIRGIYRVAELADGWNGTIISTQIYFNVLDGAMIVLAMYTLNFLHPSFLLFHGPYSKRN